MDGIEALSLRLRHLQHARGDDAEPRFLETAVDLADQVTGYAIWLDDRKGALQRHAMRLLN